jgi:hypothetical protein
MNRKAVSYLDHWAEMMMLVLLAVGLAVSLLADSALINYAIILMCGLVVGRFYATRKVSVPFYLVVAGFLAGFIIGAAIINKRGEMLILLLLFAIGSYLGNEFVKRKLIK